MLDNKLGQRRIVANFRLDRIEDVVDFVADVVQVPVRRLPGGNRAAGLRKIFASTPVVSRISIRLSFTRNSGPRMFDVQA